MKTQLLSVVIVVSVLAFGCGGQPRADSSFVSYFPVQMDPHPNAFMVALWVGKLVVAHGCLRVENSNGRSVLPIWPSGFSLRTSNNTIEVVDGDGELVAQVGDAIRMGGGEISDGTITNFTLQLPPPNCPGPYWLASRDIHR